MYLVLHLHMALLPAHHHYMGVVGWLWCVLFEVPHGAETRDRTFTKEQAAGLSLAKEILLAKKDHVPACAELQQSQFFNEQLPGGAQGMTAAAVDRPGSAERAAGVRMLQSVLEQL